MSNERFYKHPALPFAECRYSANSGRHYKPHMHKTFSVGAIDHGEVIYQVGGQTVRLEPGSLALINPEILHSCNPTESSKRSYYMLYLNVDWCSQLQQSLWQLETFSPVNSILLEDRSIYQQFINTMESFMEEDEVMEKEQILVDLAKIIFLKVCKPATIKKVHSLRIEELKLLLSKNLDADTPMKQMAVKLQTNPYTLIRNRKSR
ncbi:MAG: hypothetical protein HKM93_23540 [Desulfobacteraceae bacterium]|nr:hypothetical protein [Desulfobacteraceae bacterium]